MKSVSNSDSVSSELTNPPGGADVMLRVSHYALLGGLCQFIPIPFADDLAERQVRRRMVGVLLGRRGRETVEAGDLKPLWAGADGGVAARAGGFLKGLILKPIKKALRTVFFVATFRKAILEATEAVLLGHTLDRLLADGWFADDAGAAAWTDQSRRLAAALEAAGGQADRKALSALVRRSARLLKGWWREDDGPDTPDATAAADAEDLEQSLSPAQRDRLDRAAGRLEQSLGGARGQSLLAQFDAAVDAALQAGPPD